MTSVKKNYIWNLSYQILNMAIPIITTPYLARTLGAEAIGISSFTSSNMGYFLLLAVFGTTIYGKRSIARDRDDIYKASKTFWEIELFRIISSTIVLVVYIIFIYLVDQYRIIYVILITSIVNVVFDVTWFFEGLEEFDVVVRRNLLARICHIVFIFVFIKNPGDLWLYIISNVGWTCAGNLLIFLKVPKRVVIVKGINPFRNLRHIVTLFVPTIASQVFYLLDRSMIGWITNSRYENGCYAEAEKIVNVAFSIVAALSSVILPRVANVFNKGIVTEVGAYVTKACRFVLFITIPMMLGLLAINNFFIPVFLGEGYDLVKKIMPIFCLILPVYGLNTILANAYYIPTNREKTYTSIIFFTGILNVFFNFLAIFRHGAYGAVVATLIVETIGFLYSLFICSREKVIVVRNLIKPFIIYVFSGSVMLIAIKAIEPYLEINVLSLAIMIIFGGIIYIGLLMLFKDEFFLFYLKVVTDKIKKLGN